MNVLTLRNLPDETLRWLRHRAAHHGRSVNAELLDLIEAAKAVELAELHPESPFARSVLLAAQLGVKTPRSSAGILRQDRARLRRT